MPEKFPLPSRPEPKVVGRASDERKRHLQQDIVGNFQNNDTQIPKKQRDRLALTEYPKQDFEKLFIADTNRFLNEVLSTAGADVFDIPEKNIRIVPDRTFKEIDGRDDIESTGVTMHERQIIIINGEALPHQILRSKVILHEMIHLKNFLSIEAPNEKQHWLRRVGLQMRSNQRKDQETGEFIAFSGLNEAVVSELEKRSFPQLVEKNPVLQQEQQALFSSKKYSARRKVLAQKENVKEDEIVYISKDGKEWEMFSYPEQRKVLNYIITALYQKNPNQFTSEDDVFKLFLKAHFGGQLLPLARSLKSTFGEDAFRILGMMDAHSVNSAHLVMDYFQKKGGRVGKNDYEKLKEEEE